VAVTLIREPDGSSTTSGLGLPTFLIIGAQKSGTSSLWAYLREHPQVFVPPVKEVHFFSEPADDVDVRRYQCLFADASGAVAVGEASTSYTMFPLTPDVPAKIASVLPGVRLIYLMRDPVERMRSAYHHRLASGTENRRIRQALLADPSYMQVSMYATQLEHYLRWFPRSQLLLLTAEELKSNREATLRTVLSFIGVDPSWQPEHVSAEYNTSAGKPRVPRAWARLFGDALIRSGAVRLLPSTPPKAPTHPLMSRRIRPSDVAIPDSLREQLVAALRPEVARLSPMMPSSFDGWGLLD
jgi:hypothetical protein